MNEEVSEVYVLASEDGSLTEVDEGENRANVYTNKRVAAENAFASGLGVITGRLKAGYTNVTRYAEILMRRLKIAEALMSQGYHDAVEKMIEVDSANDERILEEIRKHGNRER